MNISRITLCILLIFTTSCLHKNYLQRFPIINVFSNYVEQKDDITLLVHKLDGISSKQYFGADLVSKGYIPLQIRIENSGPSTYVLRPSYLDLYPAPASEIAEILHYNTSSFVYWAGAPALLFWWPATIWVAQSGYNMYDANKKIDNLVERNSLEWREHEIIINPYDVFERFIFVHAQEFRESFRVRLYNQDEKKLLTFDVKARE